MPNTPALIGRGITGAFASPRVTAAQREAAGRLLGASGPVEWVGSEAEIDAVTAVSGAGPAYVFLRAEALAAAGSKAGLDPDLALRLARHTVAGAGELMIRSHEDPAQLRRNVTSPNGTTQAALDVLMGEDGFPALLERAVEAARARAEELSKG
jgi:pyrroline-5-carboxylate reductase